MNVHRRNQSVLIRGQENSISIVLHFCLFSLTDRPTYKIITEEILICKMNLHKKIGPLFYLEAEKITFPSKLDGRTDISNYRVASLLKRG